MLHTTRRTAARNPEVCPRRQVYGCRTIDVKQALKKYVLCQIHTKYISVVIVFGEKTDYPSGHILLCSSDHKK